MGRYRSNGILVDENKQGYKQSSKHALDNQFFCNIHALFSILNPRYFLFQK